MIVLDTHIVLWWVTGGALLSKKAHLAIEKAQSRGGIVISTISAWEITLLVQQERLALSVEVGSWLRMVAAIDNVHFMPVDLDVAWQSVVLPGVFHKDPADRMIVATARKLAAPLITKDEKIRAYTHIETIW